MLVLERKLRERILIGTDVWVQVLHVCPWRRKVRLGLTAPPEIAIVREEIIGRSKDDGGRSRAADPGDVRVGEPDRRDPADSSD